MIITKRDFLVKYKRMLDKKLDAELPRTDFESNMLEQANMILLRYLTHLNTRITEEDCHGI